MPNVGDAHLTEQQKKWFASVREGLQRDTGKSLAEWVAIAQTCPEIQPRARLRWFKEVHGLLQNRASYVLGEAFPSAGGWSEPETLRDALWKDPVSRGIFEAVQAAAVALPQVLSGQRKGYSAWSGAYQFAAIRPVRGGKARLGLAVAPEADGRLEPASRSEGWSERLTSSLVLGASSEVDAGLKALIAAARAKS